jgi:uncharacterized protein (DUF2062 family)
MPFVFGIMLSIFIGYVLGGLVIFLVPLIAFGYLFYVLGKPAITRFIEKQRQKRKIRKLLKERLKYLP